MIQPNVMESALRIPPRSLDRPTPSADVSADILADKIRRQEPFFFVRYGDGALECIKGKVGATCDKEHYSPELGAELLQVWRALMRGASCGSTVFVGDWRSASFDGTSEHARYTAEYQALIGFATPEFLHFEALLLMRESEALVDFYRAVKNDPRKKVFMGPKECAGAARMLNAEHVITPMANLFHSVDQLTRELERKSFEVLLYGAGMAGNIPAIRLWAMHPDRTYVNLGSALDPLFRGKSRRQQISPERAKKLFKELL